MWSWNRVGISVSNNLLEPRGLKFGNNLKSKLFQTKKILVFQHCSFWSLLLTYLTTKLSKISIYGKFGPKVNISAVPVNHQGRQDCSSPESLWRIFFLNIRFWLGVCNSSYNFVLVKYLAGGIQLDENTNSNKL